MLSWASRDKASAGLRRIRRISQFSRIDAHDWLVMSVQIWEGVMSDMTQTCCQKKPTIVKGTVDLRHTRCEPPLSHEELFLWVDQSTSLKTHLSSYKMSTVHLSSITWLFWWALLSIMKMLIITMRLEWDHLFYCLLIWSSKVISRSFLFSLFQNAHWHSGCLLMGH